MTNEQILKKAIEKAVRNLHNKSDYPYKHLQGWNINAFINKNNEFRCSEIEPRDANIIIFSHDFAKAFFPKVIHTTKKVLIKSKNVSRVTPKGVIRFFVPEHYASKRGKTFGKTWQYHLQQMVLEEEPLKYLEKFL